jgi:sugar-specific transcriptional regulator TrmB
MEEDSLRRALERAGLTSYQAEAYLTLLELGTAPAVEVGRKCSVPVSQIYDVLRTLEDRGYVETMDQEKLYARPSEPEAITGDLQSRSELLADAAEAVEERYKQPQLMDHKVAVTARSATAVDRATELVEGADVVVELAATYDQLEHLRPALAAARERDVVVRATAYTYPGAAPGDEFDPDGAISELRTCPIPGPFLVIVDRDRTCFTPGIRSDESYGVLIQDRILPFVFHWYFLTCLWNTYPRVHLDDGGTVTYVTIEEFVRDLYDLWTDGYRLDVSIRGVDLETNDDRTVTGTITDMRYLWMDRDGRPNLTDLASFTILDVQTADDIVSVGSWGAVFEDVEIRRIDLLDVGLRSDE